MRVLIFQSKLIIKCVITYLKLRAKLTVNRHDIWRLDLFIYCRKNKISIKNEEKKGFIVTHNGSNFFIRHYPSSDFSVFKTVIIGGQYGISILNRKNNLFIIDAGSNVGFTTIYFHNLFPNSQIVSIEPDPNNYKSIIKNLSLNNLPTARVLQKALWYNNSPVQIKTDFRDRLEHSIRTVSVNNSTEIINTIQGITLLNILESNQKNKIDLLKIDIEGAEDEIFKYDESLEIVLSKTSVIMIEIHDEFNCRPLIMQKLKTHFDKIYDEGELTIGVKTLKNG